MNKTLKKTNEESSQNNWYTKLHQASDTPLHTIAATPNSKDKLNLSIFFRVWLALAIIIIIASGVVFNQLFERVEPTSKQVIEDTLVDTGKLLAVILSKPLQSGQLTQLSYQSQLDKAFSQSSSNSNDQIISHDNSKPTLSYFNTTEELKLLDTWFNKKTHSSFRVYVTDTKGRVIYDSLPEAYGNSEGQDFSQWNDVYLTLQGKYGARSTRKVKSDTTTSIMYVAQPIYDDEKKLIGMVSVGKPLSTILPYLDSARQQMLTTSITIMLISIIFAGLVAWWLQQSIAMVTRYTRSLAKNIIKPNFYLGRELNELTDTIEGMKHRLENKSYVTDYVHTLTHELKSPLTAIKASGELLADELDEEDRILLSLTIGEQCIKLQSLIDRLLLLAKVEQPSFRLDTQLVNVIGLMDTLFHTHQSRIHKRDLTVTYLLNNNAINTTDLIKQALPILADEFWLSQALDNLITNAINFADSHIDISVMLNNPNQLLIQIKNDGELIPEYALSKVFDRYFSLSHRVTSASTNHKGNGLGLTLAKQVIEHHGGHISIANNQHTDKNHKNGVIVSISLPITQP